MKKLFKPALLLAAASLILSSCGGGSSDGAAQNGDTLSGNISISGAFALYPMAQIWKDEFVKLHPNVTIDISAGGAGKGITDALSGMVDLGMVSRDINPEETQKGAWKVAVTKDAVVGVVNANNPGIAYIKQHGFQKQQFGAVFLTDKAGDWAQYTGNTSKGGVNVFTRSDACGAASMWAKFVGGKDQEDLKGTGVMGDLPMADAVKKDVNAIGFNNVIYAYDATTHKQIDGITIVPIDIDGNGAIDSTENFYGTLDSMMLAIKTGKYPSPPARDLYFVSKGKPSNPLVVAFLQYILTDGQALVEKAGYVHLPQETIDAEKARIK